MRSISSINPAFKAFALSLLIITATACSSKTSDNVQYGVVVVNAPTAGEVRRVLVSEGAQVAEGAPVVEIAVKTEAQTTPSPGESAEAVAARSIKSTQSEIEAARAEVVKHEAEVQRLTPLVASGEASQAQLEGERALYERAQQKLQKAEDAEQQAEAQLRVARQPGAQGSTQQTTSSAEQIVVARATSAGTVAVISARVGDRVTSGQPLATIRLGAQ